MAFHALDAENLGSDGIFRLRQSGMTEEGAKTRISQGAMPRRLMNAASPQCSNRSFARGDNALF
jgi:hypothetical protein